MEETDFKAGDIVFLNSGSPQMTITSFSNDNTVANVVYWNTDLNKFEEISFLTAVISIVKY